jgi:hypothetical protein
VVDTKKKGFVDSDDEDDFKPPPKQVQAQPAKAPPA